MWIRWQARGGRLFLALLDHVYNVLQVVGRNLLLLGEERDHLLVGILEIILHKPAHEGPFVLLFRDERLVLVRIPKTLQADVALALEIAYYGRYRGVGRSGLRVACQDVFDEALFQRPDVQHHFFFLSSQFFHGNNVFNEFDAKLRIGRKQSQD